MRKVVQVSKVVYDSTESLDGTSSYEIPKEWRRLPTENLGTTHLASQTPEFIEHRQFDWHDDQPPYSKKRIHAILFWFADKTGVAIHNEWVRTGKPGDNGAYVVTYFVFGCEHQYKALSPDEARAIGVYHGGSCWHVNQCQKCHHLNSYDSSD